MRRFFWCFLGTVALAGACHANLLTNGDLELPAGTTNWAGASWTVTGSNVWRDQHGARGGTHGAWIDTATTGAVSLHQDIDVPTGTCTFSGWVRFEPDSAPTSLSMRLVWMDADTNALATTTADFSQLEPDGFWRQISVTGTCDSNELDFVRAQVDVGYDPGNDLGFPHDILFDDAALYSGAYTGFPYIVNGSFERGGTNGSTWFQGSEWSVIREHFANRRQAWWANSGAWHGVLDGWWAGNHTTLVGQCVYPMGTGTYTFAIYLRQEAAFQLSNAQLRIEWRDATYTNKVQIDTTSNLIVVANDTWNRYEVRGVCAAAGLHEVRAVAEFAYGADAGGHSMYFDDARIVRGGFTNTVKTDWAYYNNLHYDPILERVPGTGGFGPFLQVNYARTTTTFFTLTDYPSIGIHPDSAGAVGFYVAYLPPHLPDGPANWVTLYTAMSNVGASVISSARPFHGWPVGGSKTVSVWRYDWPQPFSNGVPYDRPITVFYAPILRSLYGNVIEDEKYLVRLDGAFTNSYPEFAQVFHTNQWYKDCTYQHLPHIRQAVFTNGSFESFPADTNWYGIGWQGYGSAQRDDWSTHRGGRGAYLPGWYTNELLWRTFTDSAVAQPVATTGGTYTFTTWLRSDPGVNPNMIDVRLEWYDTNGAIVQVDRKDLTSFFPRDGSWHHVHVTGACLSNGLDYVLAKVYGQFWARTNDPDRVQVDNAEFYAGSYTGVHQISNRGFEEGVGGQFRGSQWYSQPEYVASYRSAWGQRHGTWAAQFDAKTTNFASYSETVAQNVTPGTGTYTFAVWLIRGTNFPVTDAEIRLGWYDDTFTNRLKADDVTVVAPPADNWWREYTVSGTCGDPDLYEVRCSVTVGCDRQTNAGAECLIDVARFFPGGCVPGVMRDWAYHNDGAADALTEQVPGLDAGPFLQIDYARTTTTFYAMLNNPDAVQWPGQTSMVYLRTSLYHPVSSLWTDVSGPMERVGSFDLSDAAPFHGLPVGSNKTVDLYRYRWTQPLGDGEVPLTNAIWVYYAPLIVLYENGVDVDSLWLLRDGLLTNEYTGGPQRFDSWYYTKDYGYNQQWTWDQDGDGMADLWELRFFDRITNCLPGADNDGDSRPNSDEWVADSVPTNNASYFHDSIERTTGAIVNIAVEAPTTNSRRYDVFWKADLPATNDWAPLGLDLPGHATGTSIWFTVTNQGDRLYYRTGVKVAPPGP